MVALGLGLFCLSIGPLSAVVLVGVTARDVLDLSGTTAGPRSTVRRPLGRSEGEAQVAEPSPVGDRGPIGFDVELRLTIEG